MNNEKIIATLQEIYFRADELVQAYIRALDEARESENTEDRLFAVEQAAGYALAGFTNLARRLAEAFADADQESENADAG